MLLSDRAGRVLSLGAQRHKGGLGAMPQFSSLRSVDVCRVRIEACPRYRILPRHTVEFGAQRQHVCAPVDSIGALLALPERDPTGRATRTIWS